MLPLCRVLVFFFWGGGLVGWLLLLGGGVFFGFIYLFFGNKKVFYGVIFLQYTGGKWPLEAINST
jgi:hypothetical protein